VPSGLLPPVRLAKTEIVTSRLGFGTARLHYLAPRERQALLAAAAELGVVHFDTAPAYGDGIAETELGRNHSTHVVRRLRKERGQEFFANRQLIPEFGWTRL
jgi:aryl-alcohol dehydrogenase-like predicted oxidoreductase